MSPRFLRHGFAAVAALALLAACHAEPPAPATRPFVVVGIDGGEWSVVRDLWRQGRLPHLAALAERGASTRLLTRYSASPVIWTTIATGRKPEDHGITDFVVPTPAGDVPVASTVRRVPAIWNMLSAAERRVAVLGWWASWPAEEVQGVVLSDRALADGLEGRIYPERLMAGFLAGVAEAEGEGEENLFAGNAATRRQDQVVAYWARQLAGDGYDLILAYFRGVDIASHNHWKHYRPDDFGDDRPPEAEIAELGERIPREYEAVDRALGRIAAAAGLDTNVLVISDHGFHAARPEIVKVGLDFDRLLERLGYQTRDAAGVDLDASLLYTHGSHALRAVKQVRFGTAADEARRAAIRRRLEADLARIEYDNGEAAFTPRDARAPEARAGADFVVEVRTRRPSRRLLLAGDPEPLAGLITEIAHISGTHGDRTHGILIAAGPDIDPAARLERFRIHDVTPTLLYGLGLPVAEDFAGRAQTELFTAEFRDAHPVRSIASWGAPGDGAVTTSAEDAELLRQLRALGYLD